MRKITTPCSADGCERYGNNAGYCDLHIQRLRKYGSPYTVKQLRGVSDLERFDFWATGWNEETRCREWTGDKDRRGYGRMYIRIDGKRKKVAAHRWAYQHYVGPIPFKMLACHHCDNPSCVTPEHLFLGTHKDNRADCIRKGRANLPRKLTPGVIAQIVERHAVLGSQRKVAAEFGLSKTTVATALRMGQA